LIVLLLFVRHASSCLCNFACFCEIQKLFEIKSILFCSYGFMKQTLLSLYFGIKTKPKYLQTIEMVLRQ
jgi:hypothetical protein